MPARCFPLNYSTIIAYDKGQQLWFAFVQWGVKNECPQFFCGEAVLSQATPRIRRSKQPPGDDVKKI